MRTRLVVVALSLVPAVATAEVFENRVDECPPRAPGVSALTTSSNVLYVNDCLPNGCAVTRGTTSSITNTSSIAFDHSPAYQLKKHYPEIYAKMIANEIEDCNNMFTQNIQKGINQGLYRAETDVEAAEKFYYTLIFSINENTLLEKEAYLLEGKALEYHTRAIATAKGLEELENQLSKLN